MKKKRATLILVCALCLPLPSTAVAMDDMFGAMFRMMLVMMNVMSDSMLENSSDFGSASSLDFGMGSWPAMGAMSGMSPISGASSFPGMSPWTGMGGMSGMNPWSGMSGMPGMSPWSGMSGMPGMSPWSGMSGMPGMNPWSGMSGIPGYGTGMTPWSNPMPNNTWSNPFTSGYPSYPNTPYNAADYGGQKYRPVSLLDGRWFGYSDEILEVRGNRFRLMQGQYSINGIVKIKNNIVNLYSPETGTVTQYTFMVNQSELMLQDANGQVLSFNKRPVNGAVHVF